MSQYRLIISLLLLLGLAFVMGRPDAGLHTQGIQSDSIEIVAIFLSFSLMSAK